MAGIINCGYARVAAKHSLLKENGKVEYDQKERYHKFNRVFEGKYDANFHLEYEIYRVKSKDIASTFNKRKNNEHKGAYLKHFSASSWKSLPQIQKQQHTLRDCKACSVHHFTFQSAFPLNTNRLKSQNPAKRLQDISNVLKNKKKNNSNVKVKPTSTSVKEAAKFCYEELDKSFSKLYSTSFADALTKVKGLNLKRKATKLEQKQKLRKLRRDEKENIKHQWEDMEVISFLGSRKSYSQYEQDRKTMYFETKSDAKLRVLKQKAREEIGEIKTKRHSPDHAKVNFDRAGLLHKVESMNPGDEVNDFNLQQSKLVNMSVV